MPVLTLTTDFGLDDYYVGAVKGTVLRLAGIAAPILVDLSHTVAPGDVAAAAYLLAGAAPTFPPGTLHLAIVDPGVGSDRRIVALRVAGQLFLAPDNGLLTPWLVAPPTESWAVVRQELFLSAPGSTFHGRDRFAPAAAFLLCGGDPAALGPVLDDPVTLPPALPRRESGRLTGQVVHIDRFGNLITDLPGAWLPPGDLVVAVAGRRVSRRVACYAALAAGEPGILVGSRGTLELSLRGASLAARWRVARGAPVVAEPAAP